MDNNIILVHANTIREYGYDKSVEKLRFFGYKVLSYTDYTHPLGSGNAVYVIDRRSPNWRGWRDIVASIEWRHYDKNVEYARLKDKESLDNTPVVSYNEEEEISCII